MNDMGRAWDLISAEAEKVGWDGRRLESEAWDFIFSYNYGAVLADFVEYIKYGVSLEWDGVE